MDHIYRDIPLPNIPWNVEQPPPLLVEAVESGKIKPCRAVDLGCGAGNYAVWLAGRGFDVTGIDISAKAIEHARKLATVKGVACRFVVLDLLGDLSNYRERFDFAYDWELLHHIFPEDRERYLRNVHRLLRPDGAYFSICFSETDPSFGGRNKYRKTNIGTTLYFSSEAELRELFEKCFTVSDLRTVEIPGKHGSHLVIAAWLKPL
ncbi:class I SAM-dependent methyltransferase [candidate division GN15 bacterium]|uniref:Class I SAM-dependent methyltransferase n=1 Tax=candidate division GN15 bacterium TaxID=2072418 RepID=A0A855X0U5_9BACT|nr:MAG: class I SAM-dependent methyltransferase [candidate division GN15 bacterium]